MMDAKTAAAALDGNDYGSEGSAELFAEMKAARLICLFGYSDDVVEVRGYANDEFGTGNLYFTDSGLIVNRCEEDGCPYFAERKALASRVEVFDGGDEFGMFEFRTDIPHVRFDIIEDGELYSSGIVFALADVA